MKMKNLSCEERIDEKLRSRITEIEKVLNLYKNSEDGSFEYKDCRYENIIDWINSYALSFSDHSKYRAKTLELSWGGPADGFIFFEDGEIRYYFQDWSDGAERTLSGKDREILEILREYLIIE